MVRGLENRIHYIVKSVKQQRIAQTFHAALCLSKKGTVIKMGWNLDNFILDADDIFFENIFSKILHLVDKKIFCVVQEKNLVGIISVGDLDRYRSEHGDTSYLDKTAYEISNKQFIKFHIDNIEFDVEDFLRTAPKNVKYVPIVDNNNNLITVVSVNSFVNEQSW